jgi:hypothetical protein
MAGVGQAPLRDLISEVESAASLPEGSGERFRGYGVMGVPFASGHVLAFRHFPASSIGTGYKSVWHRNPNGEWTFYADVGPGSACTRFFGAAVSNTVETEIQVSWPDPFQLGVSVPAALLAWTCRMESTPATRIMNSVGRLMPSAAWHNRSVLRIMAAFAGPLLGVGHVGLEGVSPNGQHFIANPRQLWMVSESSAQLSGEDFGRPGPLHTQAKLGDFWIPQRGSLAIGETFFEAFDSSRHSATMSQATG